VRQVRPSPRRVAGVALLFFLLALFRSQSGQSQDFDLHFSVHYLGMRVGSLRIQAWDSTATSGTRLRVVHLYSKTARLAGAVFGVEDSYTVVYDPVQLRVLSIAKSIRQSNLTHDVVIEYADEHATLHNEVTRRWNTPGPVLDVVSLMDVLLRVRAPDTTFTVPLDQEAAPMKAWARVYSGEKGRFATAIVRKAGKKLRHWKTDLLTNRFSKEGARLELRFRTGETAPYQLRYSLGPAMATAKLVTK